MKLHLYIKTIPLALIAIFACGKSQITEICQAKALKEPHDCGIKIEELTHYTTPRKQDTFQMLYVVNHNFANQYLRPDTNSKILGKYKYSDNIWIDRLVDTVLNGERSYWYLIDENITDKKLINSREYSSNFVQPVFVRKEDLGPESKIMISENEIYEVWNQNFDPSQSSRRFVSIQSLGHDDFYKTPSPNDWERGSYYWNYDAAVDRFELKLNKSDTLLRFRNTPFQTETNFHVYTEDVEQLNSYLVFAGFYESHRFMLYDKGNGETKASLIGYPCISPKKKYIVSFYNNPYGLGGGELQVHAITKTGPYKLLHSFNFINWRPFEDPMEFVWVNDREFKIKVYSDAKHFRKWIGTEFAPRTGYLKFRIL